MNILHTKSIKNDFVGVQQFSDAKILLRDVSDPAIHAWIVSLYRRKHPMVTDDDFEALPWPEVVNDVLPVIVDCLQADTAPEDVLIMLFGGNHSTWALQMMVEEGKGEKDHTLLRRSVIRIVQKLSPKIDLVSFFEGLHSFTSSRRCIHTTLWCLEHMRTQVWRRRPTPRLHSH
jgi:hypothetical protein